MSPTKMLCSCFQCLSESVRERGETNFSSASQELFQLCVVCAHPPLPLLGRMLLGKKFFLSGKCHIGIEEAYFVLFFSHPVFSIVIRQWLSFINSTVSC